MRQLWELIQENLGADFAEDEALLNDVRRLSLAFTEERDELPADYLADEHLRAAYLAYYLPLNFEKVRMLLGAHAKELWSTAPTEPQKWLDFGSGPATASLAAMAALHSRVKGEKLPPIGIDLVDTEGNALTVGAELVRQFAQKLGMKVEVSTHAGVPYGAQYDLSLAANVLNELPAESGAEGREMLMQVWDQTRGALLVLEPGHRVSSQRLVRFRERLLKESRAQTRLVGPCPHSEKCPVHRTKHWCHFSEPLHDGRLIDLNLRVFKNPREWLKFSYVLFSRGEPKKYDPRIFRAIGDAHLARGRTAIDLCQPNEKFLMHVPHNLPPQLKANLVRGASVLVEDHKISAIPLTRRKLKEPADKDRWRDRPKREVRPGRPRELQRDAAKKSPAKGPAVKPLSRPKPAVKPLSRPKPKR